MTQPKSYSMLTALAITGVGSLLLWLLNGWLIHSSPLGDRSPWATTLVPWGIALIIAILWQHRIAKQVRGDRALVEQRYQYFIDHLNVGVITHTANAQILSCNAKACELLEFSSENLLGKRVGDLGLQFFREDESEMPLAEVPIYQVIATGEPLRDRIIGVWQADHKRKMWALVSAFPEYDSTQQLQQIIVTFSGITDCRRTIEVLQEQEARYQLLFNSSNDAIFVHPFKSEIEETRFTEVNDVACQMLGYSREELLQLGPADLNAPEVWEQIPMRVQKLLEERKILFELVLLTKTGKTLPVELNACLFELDGQLTVLSIARDISNRKRNEQEQQQQTLREQQLRAITNRIRQSLNLDDILTTTVNEVFQFLQCDRVLIFRLYLEGAGQVIQESVRSGYPAMAEMLCLDECFPEACYEFYQQAQPRIVNDVIQDEWGSCLVEVMVQEGVKSKIVAPIVHLQSGVEPFVWGILSVHDCTGTRQWQPAEAHFLQQIANQLAIALHHADLHRQVENELNERRRAEYAVQQALEREQQLREREHFISNIAQSIRRSLELEDILAVTVEEVRHFLQSDRVLIYHFQPDLNGHIIAESTSDPAYSILQQDIRDSCFSETMAQPYRQGRIHIVNDIHTANLDPCYVSMLSQLNVRSVLVIPIQLGETLWGLLVAHQCKESRQWQQVSWYLLQQLSTQLAIGIHQSELHQQVQQLNSNLEAQVQSRTAQLQAVLDLEAVLRRITDAVRDSLDEAQILQTAVRELAIALNLSACDAALYNDDRTTSTIVCDFAQTLQSARNEVLPMDQFAECYQQLLSGHYIQFCYLSGQLLAPRSDVLAQGILACPICDDQAVIGDLWLFRADYGSFNEQELQLVEQVANQCAIALRQSRLYQAVQAQVAALEQLNRLKDDFLSTVSHELRTPMSNIKMAIRMIEIVLKREGMLQSSETPLQRYFQILKTECERETNLINDLLDLARIDAGIDPLALATINLQTLIPQITEPFLERISQQQQSLKVYLPADLPSITTDVTHLVQ